MMKKPLKVLVLEDSADDTQLLLLQLEQEGIEVEWQRVETEADFRAALDAHPDLILADYSLPNYRGLTALGEIHERGLDIPFIIVSGSIGEELAVECLRLGAADYLLKDRLARLGLAVTRAVELARLRVEQRQAEERLRRMATHDSLTCLYNRIYFEEEMARVERGRMFPVSVVVADVDGLKPINDTYGHAVGDEVLRRAAMALRSAFRAEDVIARIGGDEFAALLPGVTEQLVEAALERLRDCLSAGKPIGGSSALSMSLGAATLESGRSMAETLKRADEQMYRDKFARASRATRGFAS